MALEREGVGGDAALQEMSKRAGVYDPQVLELCFKYYPEYLSTSISKDKAVKTIDLDSLEPGQALVSDVQTSEGLLLVEAGNWLTAAAIIRIRNFALLGQVTGPLFVQSAEENDAA